MKNFSWGKVLQNFEYDFDGVICTVVKYHPWECNGAFVRPGSPNKEKINFHCEEIHASFESIEMLLIAWIANKKLGRNQDALVVGISRSLCLFKEGDA